MENSNRFANKRKTDYFGDDGVVYSDRTIGNRVSSPSPNLEKDLDDVKFDDLLAKELLKMSFVDRNAINEEIHGVRSLAVDETPRLISNSLESFRTELGLLPDSEQQAYLFIQTYRKQQNQQQHTTIFASYADDDNFRLRFLRCCMFKVQLAVKRFANYLNFVQTHWGDSYLARPIRISDLNAAEIKILRRGWTQILPFRDRRGRRVVAQLTDGSDMEDISVVKVWFYMFDCVSRDSVETQKQGVVSILDGGRYMSYTRNNPNANNFAFNPETRKLIRDMLKLGTTLSPLIAAHHAMPTRVVSIHVCWPLSPLVNMVSKLYMIQSDIARSDSSPLEMNRIKIHSGEETEMRYIVKSYGVPIELMPLTGTNIVKLNYHNQWVKTRKLVEANQIKYQSDYNYGHKPEYECEYQSACEKNINNKIEHELLTIVECPCFSDVIFRNGTQSMENPGNAMFRNSILSYWEEREQARLSSSCINNNSNNSNLLGAAGTISAADDAHDRKFRDDLVREIEVEKKGRFLVWNKSLNVWVQIRNKKKIQRKVAMVFYNCTKRRHNNIIGKSNNANKRRTRSTTTAATKCNSDDSRTSSSLAYQFIDKSRLSEGKRGLLCCGNSSVSGSSDDDEMMTNKRPCLW